MAWLEITVNTASRDVEDVAARLTARGYSDLVIEDQAEFESFLEENRAYWDYIDEEFQEKLEGLSRIRLYLEETDEAGLARLRETAAELRLTPEVRLLPETDWAESWKDSYPPQEVGKNLVVLPYWLADEETDRKKIILDPGLTFGTGAHPSTQMVMEAMEQRVKPGWHCLDLGSGSGILSITALRLGAQTAVGVDIDPKAEDIARENA
ncbi:MAG TPA: 50S ribosomal protein L11 methyltransferase, partial [Clostridiales bacterium]|nr:50S ribosomal protein L11 methyltransferase [Clostridiales bacterium]